MKSNTSEISLHGIRLLLQNDEINDSVNILYLTAIRAGIKTTQQGKNTQRSTGLTKNVREAK
jgi:hypothetical protein